MNARHILWGGAVIVLCVAAAAQYRVFQSVRAESQELARQQEEANRLRHENERLEDLVALKVEIDEARRGNQDLPRLRNEVTQLRAQAQEVERIQKENEQLKAAAAQAGSAPKTSRRQAEFVTTQAAQYAGFTTREAAVQTIVWALQQPDPAALTSCLPVQMQESLKKDLPRLYDQLKREFGKSDGYRIVASMADPSNPSLLGVGIQLSSGKETVLVLQRVENEWRLTRP